MSATSQICTCGVPNVVHGATACGWLNATVVTFNGENIVRPFISPEEKELRYLISQSPNALDLIRLVAFPVVITEAFAIKEVSATQSAQFLSGTADKLSRVNPEDATRENRAFPFTGKEETYHG